MTLVNDNAKSVNAYNLLMDSGILLGYYGKYLPNPEESLPFILSLLNREYLLSAVYK